MKTAMKLVLVALLAAASTVAGQSEHAVCLTSDITSPAFQAGGSCSCEVLTGATASQQNEAYNRCTRCYQLKVTSTATSSLSPAFPYTVDNALFRRKEGTMGKACMGYSGAPAMFIFAMSQIVYASANTDSDKSKMLNALKCTYGTVKSNLVNDVWKCANCYLYLDNSACPVAPPTRTVYVKITLGNTAYYMSNSWLQGAYTGIIPSTAPVGNRLQVKFDPSSQPFNLLIQNGPVLNPANAGSELLGGIQGRDSTSASLGPGSFNYLYLGTIATPTPALAPPVADITNSYSTTTGLARKVASAVWYLDGAQLLMKWVNEDGGQPTSVTLLSQAQLLYILGDQAQFCNRYPGSCTTSASGIVTLTVEDV